METTQVLRNRRKPMVARDSAGISNKKSEDLFYSESNMKALERSWKQIEEGKVVTKTMEELEAMVNA